MTPTTAPSILIKNQLLLFFFYFLLFHVIESTWIPLDLESHFNHRAFGQDANVDGLGQHYIPKQNEPKQLMVGVPFKNAIDGIQNDNICIQGTDQSWIQLSQQQSMGALYLLVSSSHGPVVTDIQVKYQDDSVSVSRLVIPDWQQEQDPHQVEKWEMITRPVSNSQQLGGLYSIPVYLDPAKTPISLMITIPSVLSTSSFSRGNNGNIQKETKTTTTTGLFAPSIHVFAATVMTSTNALQMTAARATRRFWNQDAALIPVLLVRLHNIGPLAMMTPISVTATSRSIRTIHPGSLDHLAPGHVASLDIGIEVAPMNDDMDNIRIQVITADKIILDETIQLSLSLYHSEPYEPTKTSLQQHQAPTWYQQAKFGIFIHWGLYSIPAWAPVGKEYAEWYWWQMNHPDDPTFDHHRQRFGTAFAYDDFIPMWQPTSFDPRTWLDLINTSRAKYFVFTAKHHDGFALFDTKVTNRSSVQLQPHRDFVHDLINTSKEYYPHLKRGIYCKSKEQEQRSFSMPEWYHPSYHDNDLSDWHGPPFNPYTKQEIPYTGSPPIHDFVNELQLPQLEELVNNYEPDIIWCDIGGINNSSMWQAKYYNQATKQNRQVTINDRCGNGISDFTTLEYQETSTPPPRSWEATRGIDPRSFGFNQATPPEDYASSTQLIHELIDAASMGGNFLLNIGPTSTGDIFHTMVERLHDIGAWLDQNGISIFDADPYWMTTQDKDVRFMMGHQGSLFYIIVLDRSVFIQNNNNKDNHLMLRTPLPLQSSSTITLLNGQNNTASLPWTTALEQQITVSIINDIPNILLDQNQHAWVFKCIL
ncbi:glycoside hydrolase superfamily [Halteromyces radiatus]|uniref:glycoside hydrolase superfamily n=1 Tax=Halteromyces radiatus TaxID=101107 RepID=UPI00222087DE|nr:glycoside hydrolase superfamily [Halteromyces radiatus]KAI8093869.1 glycoside hydrolase superfamily [Halteromyces radiatus]